MPLLPLFHSPSLSSLPSPPSPLPILSPLSPFLFFLPQPPDLLGSPALTPLKRYFSCSILVFVFGYGERERGEGGETGETGTSLCFILISFFFFCFCIYLLTLCRITTFIFLAPMNKITRSVAASSFTVPFAPPSSLFFHIISLNICIYSITLLLIYQKGREPLCITYPKRPFPFRKCSS